MFNKMLGMKSILLFTFTFLGWLLPLQGEERELVVVLDGEESLVPVCFDPIESVRSGFSDDYLKQLEGILRFDFDHNGTTALNSSADFAVYRLKPVVKEHQLSVSVSSSVDDSEVCFKDLRMTGYLEEDRRSVHALSDKIHAYLFDSPGIASTRILYTIKQVLNGKDSSAVWECDYDGGNPKRISRMVDYIVTPSYIPPKAGHRPGSYIYTGYATGQPKIYVASLQEGKGRMLIDLAGNQLMPALSKQRDQIAFISDVTGNPDLFIQRFDPENGVSGKPRHLFTAPQATQGSPSFSPDGTRLAFVSDKSGTPMVYVLRIPPPGTPLNRIPIEWISKLTKDNTAPAWSPDGSKIAYCAKIHGIRQIMVHDMLTGSDLQLTSGPGNKENPSWAPNSLHLVYNTSDPSSCDLYVVNLKNRKPVKISAGSGDKRFPCWEPSPSSRLSR